VAIYVRGIAALEFNMRILPSALVVTLLLAAPALQASTKHSGHVRATAAPLLPPACQFDTDRSALEIEGLKSQLMVTALACKEQDKYNAFMSRYQPEVARAEQNLSAYFKRSYGRQATTQYDAYITNLADVQEQDGLKAGTSFCSNLPAMFDEVMSLHDSSELPAYTNAKVIAQPITFNSCAGPQPAAAPATRKVRHASKARQHA
jgi:hypothetical protein